MIKPGCKNTRSSNLRESRVKAANTVFHFLSQILFYDG
jgi:hypothetical protein